MCNFKKYIFLGNILENISCVLSWWHDKIRMRSIWFEFCRDPNKIRRSATHISWHPEGSENLAVAYCNLQFQSTLPDTSLDSYIWDVGMLRFIQCWFPQCSVYVGLYQKRNSLFLHCKTLMYLIMFTVYFIFFKNKCYKDYYQNHHHNLLTVLTCLSWLDSYWNTEEQFYSTFFFCIPYWCYRCSLDFLKEYSKRNFLKHEIIEKRKSVASILQTKPGSSSSSQSDTGL